ncbi:unnamed protein product [Schistosoma curassoni]|uniref:Secreted protein n=1 Tax=Schistosoma curassoni TaxID=6186 RepID=A0A183JKH6_9TREM|nr:unnamed protein product [Schistosoma curassoni]
MYFASMTACTPVKFVVKSSIALCVFSLIISGWLKSRRGSKDSKILCLNVAVRPIACWQMITKHSVEYPLQGMSGSFSKKLNEQIVPSLIASSICSGSCK